MWFKLVIIFVTLHAVKAIPLFSRYNVTVINIFELPLELKLMIFLSVSVISVSKCITRDRTILIRGQIVAKKITDEENRTARKSHCEPVERQQCIADTPAKRPCMSVHSSVLH